MAVFCTPTVNGYGRFKPNALAPQSLLWGRDNRGALLRVVGGSGDAATRIENRLGEPAANPYLYMAAQVHAGLDGGSSAGCAHRRQPTHPMAPPMRPACPTSLNEALKALADDHVLTQAFGADFVAYLQRIDDQSATTTTTRPTRTSSAPSTSAACRAACKTPALADPPTKTHQPAAA